MCFAASSDGSPLVLRARQQRRPPPRFIRAVSRASREASEEIATFERDFTTLTGISLARFLDDELCERHVPRIRRRPVLWQIASRPEKSRKRPALACVVHAHRSERRPFSSPIADRAREPSRRPESEPTPRALVESPSAFDRERSAEVAANVRAASSDDGVRVNIAPLQRAGLLGVDVLAPPDVERAIADRARWRGARPTA